MHRTRLPATLLALVSLAAVAHSQPIDVSWMGGGGDQDWTNAGNWTPSVVPNNGGGQTYNVTTNNATITLDAQVEIDTLRLNDGGGNGSSINGGSILEVKGTVEVDLGIFDNVMLEADGMLSIERSLELDAAIVDARGGVTLGAGTADGLLELNAASTLQNPGTFDFVRAGDVTGTTGMIVNTGTIRKSGPGLSTIAAGGVQSTGGTIDVQLGVLALRTSQLTATSLLIDPNAILLIGGLAEENQFSGSVSATVGGELVLEGGEVRIDGSLLVSGPGYFEISGNTELAGNGLLQADANVPASVRGATIGQVGAIRNNGHMDLVTADIVGLTNETDGRIQIVSGIGGQTAVQGSFTNDGGVNQGATITVEQGGVVQNNADWLYQRGNINTNLSQPGTFRNSGTMTVDGLGGQFFTGVVNAPFRLNNGGTIDVVFGEMRVGGTDPNATRYENAFIAVDGQRSVSNAFSFGLNSTSRSTLDGVSFTLSNNGKARFLGGTHRVKSDLVSGGDGVIELLSATLDVTSPLTIRTQQNAPFYFNNQNGTLNCASTAGNEDYMRSSQGAITGSAEFQNRSGATFEVLDLLRISRGSDGTFRNQAQLLLSGSDFEGITIDTGGQLLNDAGGEIVIATNADITRQPFGGAGAFINEGLTRKAGGNAESLITTSVYRQDGQAELRSESGTIGVFADLIEFLGGTLSAHGSSARVRVRDSSLTEDVQFDFLQGGVVEYPGTTSVLHEIVGTLKGTGEGSLQHSGGTMRPRDTFAILEFGEDPNQPGNGSAEFWQFGGTLGEAGGQLINRGNLRMTGGTLLGTFDNTGVGGNFDFDGGTIQETFNNNGNFVWSGGTLDAQVSNSASGSDSFEIDADTNVLLATDANLTNTGRMDHSGLGDLLFGQNVTLTNQAGAEYVITDGGDITRQSGAIQNARIVNQGRIANEGAANASISVLFESTGGMIEADSGPLNINGVIGQTDGEPRITGGSLLSSTSSSNLTTASAELRGGILHSLGVEGLIEHSLPNIDATLTASGIGTVEISSGTADGGQMQLVAGAGTKFVFRGTNGIGVNAASNGGDVQFLGTTFNLFADGTAGGFDATSALEFRPDSGANTSIRGLDSGSRAVFTSNLTAVQTGGSDLEFDGAVQFDNVGSYDLTSDGGISAVDGFNNDILMHNSGTFTKSEGLSSSFSTISIPFRNSGTVEVQKGNLRISPFCTSLSGTVLTEGTWIVDPNTSLSLNNGITLTENDGTIKVKGNGDFKNLPTVNDTDFQNDGTLCLEDGATMLVGGEFENNGTVKVGSGSTLGVQTLDNDSDLAVDGTLTFTANARFQSGTTRGTGTISGPGQVRSSNTIAPGKSPGILTIQATFLQDPNATLAIELGGLTVGTEYDRLAVQGDATIAGTLDVQLLDGFTPLPGDSFTILTATNLSGSFLNAPPTGGVGSVTFAEGTCDVLYSSTSVQLTNFQRSGGCPGDADGDLDVDLSDLAIVLGAFGAMQGDAGYVSGADFDGNGSVDLSDLATVLGSFGVSCP